MERGPASVCHQWGEKVVKAEVGQLIAALAGNATLSRKARTIPVPVIRFARQVA